MTQRHRLLHSWPLAVVLGMAAPALPALPQAGAATPDCPPAQTQAPVQFRLRLAHGMAGPEIAMRIACAGQDTVKVAMPVWKPGSYSLENFSDRVKELTASGDDGKELKVEHAAKHEWTIETAGSKTVEVRYQVQPRRGGGLGPSKVQDGGARGYAAYEFEGPATWLYVPGRLQAPQQVTFDLPEGWKIATGMLPTDAPRVFQCADYDTFADCPFRVGEFEERTFTVAGVPHRIVWSGFMPDDEACDLIAKRYERIVKAQVAMMGPPPYPFYVFLITAPGGAGLEHLNSTSISMMAREGTPDGNSIWDSIVSHEFFHLWNVKRLRPKALGPFDYTGPNRTKYLWLSEGVTSYYGDLLLVRSGVWDEKAYWTEAIANEINTLQRNPGRLAMSVAEASRTVWDGPYMRRRNVPDYYNKGQLLGLLLDIEIRDATENKSSLDDVMRSLYEQCMREGKGFEDGDVQKTCEKVAGRSFAKFFADYVDGVAELPFKECLAKIGITLVELRPPAPASAESSASASQPASASRPATGRRRAATLALRIDPTAPERAKALRKHMTRVVVE